MGVDLTTQKNKFDIREFFSAIKNSVLATQNTIGIDAGEGYIKIVQLQRSRGGYLLTDYRVRAIPFKLKNNPKEKNRFIKEFINEFIAQSKIKTSLGRLAIKGSGIFTFSFSLPPLSEKDLRGTVGIELKKRLPFQLDFKNMSFNYFVTDRFDDEPPSIMVTCIAVDNSALDKYLDFLKSFNLRPVVINTGADALGNLMHSAEGLERVAVLDMGSKQSYLHFYKTAALQFARDIPVGGEHLTQGILKALTPLGADVAFEDAEAFKRQCGVPMQEEADAEFYTDYGAIKGNQITTALRPVLERLVTEISRTTTFYFRTYKIDSLDALYLTGGASRIKNIDKFLLANLGNLSIKTVERLDSLKAIRGWRDVGVFRQELVMEEAAPHLAVAFGLCIDNGGAINLVPPREKIEQKALFVMFLVRLTFPIVLISALGFYSFSYARGLIYKTIETRAQSQIGQYSPIVKDVNDYLEIKRKLEEREALLAKAIGKQPLWGGVLKELSNITPQEVVLHRFEVVAGKLPRQLTIIGEVVSEYTNLDLAISQYTLNMSESPYFSDVKLVSSERDIYSPVPKALFEIMCDLKI
ncbi:MAG: pilus assembly protein PilM [Candidatus Omnitrophica bacterium]|nr:pilus assembly protein PilM [Candidatus Omnitrophota bacterium]